jgi:HEAT repeat protein
MAAKVRDAPRPRTANRLLAMTARLVRAFAWLALALFLFAVPVPRAAAGEDDEQEPAAREPKCTCATSNACWHYLRAPVEPANDPCWCPKCTPDAKHDGTKPPEGWNPQCFTGKSLDCFLRRHAASWRITCSECLDGVKCCDFKNPDRCPACGEGDAKDPFAKDAFGKDARASAAERVAIEQKVFDKKKPCVAYSRRFYVVTDVQKLAIRTQGGQRYVDAHEYAHVVLERAEKAYREFDQAFKGRVGLLRPMGIFLPQRETTGFAIREAYFRNKNAPMIYSSYAGASESHISQGFCLNGLCVSVQQAGGDDTGLYHAVRHLMGNILVTCWCVRNGDNKTMPRWVFEGAAHWLGKRHPDLADEVWYCIGEEKKVSGSGKAWMRDLASAAAKGGFSPFDEFLDKSSLGQLTLDDHRRAWGIFEICMAEWREPFVAMLADLRREVPVADAFKKNLGCTSAEFNQRWIERLTGVRKPITEERVEKPVETKTDWAASDPADVVSSQIRALGTITDPALVAKVIDVMGRHGSDLVRETALQSLRRLKDEACRKKVWEYGLAHSERFARAYSARLCRQLHLPDARDALRKLLDDSFWMARCDAAMALAKIKDFDSQARMRAMCEDASSKVRIGAMDALAMLGTEANEACVPIVAKNLNHPDWQVRVAACQDLRKLGNYMAIDALVARLQVEGGRVGDEVLRTLKWLSDEDLGEKPENWKKWWEREGGRVKERKGFDPKPKTNKADERYAKPKPEEQQYYGVRLFSHRVGFVLDVSRSTNRKFNPDSSTQSLLHKKYEGATIFQIARDEVAASVAALDSRAHFNVIAFGSEVRRWQNSMVPATEGNKNGADGFVHSYEANGETNFYGSLSAALDLDTVPMTSSDLRDTLDTMVFLTDGTPTVGEITDADLLLEWYGELNRYYRVRTHTYAFGTLEVDEGLLRKLAERNDGRFTQLYEEN